MAWGIIPDLAITGVAAAASLTGAAAYAKARTSSNRDTIATLQANVTALRDQANIIHAQHEAMVAELTRELEEVRREGRVIQHQAVTRISMAVADRMSQSTADLLTEIRNELRNIRVTLNMLRRAIGTRGVGTAELVDDDDEEVI